MVVLLCCFCTFAVGKLLFCVFVFCAFVLFLLSVFYDSILDFVSFVFFFCSVCGKYLVSSNMCLFVVAFLFFFPFFNFYFVCCSFCGALWGALCSWVFFSFLACLFLFVVIGFSLLSFFFSDLLL